jgi:6-phosphogluconolactonase
MSEAPELRIMRGREELAREAADFVLWVGQQALAQAGRCRIVLAGGATPRALYRTLASAGAAELDWQRVEFFFGDERCVPPDHADSNYRLAHETLFTPLKIDPNRVARMVGEASDPDTAARRYEAIIRDRCSTPAPVVPAFDLVLLGLGEDGHTASLFPHAPALEERVRLVVGSVAPREPRQRVTLTLPAINSAGTVVFLVSGAAKAPAVRAVLEPRDEHERRLPARLIRPGAGRLVWFLDREAAAHLAAVKQHVDDREE